VRTIYWDTMLFVYLLESNPVYVNAVLKIQEEHERRNDTLVTSIFTIGETLIGPRKLGDLKSIASVRAFFTSGSIKILPFDLETTERFSEIRAANNVTQADAIHLASASIADVDLYLTNDKNLLRLNIPGIKFFADLSGRIF
jgi:uncharacterized protein